MYKRKESLNIGMKSLEMSPQVRDAETNETKCLQTMLWAGPLNSPNPQIYDYYTPSKWSTPRTAIPSSKYLMNASPSNFSTQPTDQNILLGKTQETSKDLKAELHNWEAASQWINRWSTSSPLHRHVQH